MNASAHPIIVEYAVREMFKYKTPRTAALATKNRLAKPGSTNLFIEGGSVVVEIDQYQLEEQLWRRMASRAIAGAASMKPGHERFAVEATLQEYCQKITPKNVTLLEAAIRIVTDGR